MDSPIVTATWQAGLLSGISNILAQLITCWRTGVPYSIDLVSTFHFVLFSALACPPNVVWQAWLEAQYPAYGKDLPTTQKEAIVDKAVTSHTTATEEKHAGARSGKAEPMTQESSPSTLKSTEKSLNKRNTAIKFVLDQTLGAIVNNLLFIAGLGMIRGQTTSAIQKDIYEQFGPIMRAGLKLWPLVSLLNFTLVPLEYRMLLGNVVGLFWGIFLSLTAGSS